MLGKTTSSQGDDNDSMHQVLRGRIRKRYFARLRPKSNRLRHGLGSIKYLDRFLSSTVGRFVLDIAVFGCRLVDTLTRCLPTPLSIPSPRVPQQHLTHTVISITPPQVDTAIPSFKTYRTQEELEDKEDDDGLENIYGKKDLIPPQLAFPKAQKRLLLSEMIPHLRPYYFHHTVKPTTAFVHPQSSGDGVKPSSQYSRVSDWIEEQSRRGIPVFGTSAFQKDVTEPETKESQPSRSVPRPFSSAFTFRALPSFAAEAEALDFEDLEESQQETLEREGLVAYRSTVLPQYETCLEPPTKVRKLDQSTHPRRTGLKHDQSLLQSVHSTQHLKRGLVPVAGHARRRDYDKPLVQQQGEIELDYGEDVQTRTTATRSRQRQYSTVSKEDWPCFAQHESFTFAWAEGLLKEKRRRRGGRNQGRYPHCFLNHSALPLRGKGPYFTFPLLPYPEFWERGKKPGPYRVILDRKYRYANIIAHNDAPRGGFSVLQ